MKYTTQIKIDRIIPATITSKTDVSKSWEKPKIIGFSDEGDWIAVDWFNPKLDLIPGMTLDAEIEVKFREYTGRDGIQRHFVDVSIVSATDATPIGAEPGRMQAGPILSNGQTEITADQVSGGQETNYKEAARAKQDAVTAANPTGADDLPF